MIAVHNEAMARSLVDPRPSCDDTGIFALAKETLSLLQVATGNDAAKGLGQVNASLRPLLLDCDRSKVAGQIRGLHEAYNFCRHLTDVGREAWLNGIQQALVRAKLPVVAKAKDGGGVGGATTVTESLEVEAAQTSGKGKRRRRKARAAFVAMDAVDEVTEQPLLSPNAINVKCKKKQSSTRGVSLSAGDEIQDAWADEVGDACSVLTSAAASAIVPFGTFPPVSGSTRTLQRGPSDEGVQPASKVCRAVSVVADAAGAYVPAFLPGDMVFLAGLVSRPDLLGAQAIVLSFAHVTGRYAVRLGSGEEIRVRPDCLFGSA